MTQTVTVASPRRPSIPCTEPASGRKLGEVLIDSPAAVREAVRRAREVQPTWAALSFRKRRAVLRHIQDHVLKHADELCEMIVRDAGKTPENAMVGEIWPVNEKLRWTLSRGEACLRPERVSSGLFLHKKATIEYRPRGVIGIVAPWNYPLQNVLGPVVPALMAGNACVVKVSEQVAWSSTRIQWIFDEAFDAFGLPRDLVRIVNGYAESGAALVSGGVDLLVFTGSMENGRKVIAESAKTITPVILELGGKDAMIVCDDADLEQAAHAAMAGSFIAAGQNCLAAERTLVMEGIYDRFVARVAELAGTLRQGTPQDEHVDVGALVTEQQLAIVERLVDDAIEKGARAVVGGKRAKRAGHFFEPTVLVDVTPDMAIMQEETFGPVMAICRVEDEEEAIRVANGTQYGLSATVLSKSAARARRIADRIVSGSASINDYGLTYMAQELPFGGERGSGFGRLNGREGIRALCNVRSLLEDRLPLHVPAKLFPVSEHDYAITRGVIRTIYSKGVKAKARALGELASAARSKFSSKPASRPFSD